MRSRQPCWEWRGGLSPRVTPGYHVSATGQPGVRALDLDLLFTGVAFLGPTWPSLCFLLAKSGKARFLGTAALSPRPSL